MTPSFLFPPAEPVVVPIEGRSEVFPVRRIFCVGRNYAEHAREMGNTVDRDEPPFYFLKDASAIVPNGATLPYPPGTADFHHEIEFVVAIGGVAERIPVEDATTVVFGYALGLDLTRRDLQAAAKATRRPWDFAKNFEHSAPITAIVPADRFGAVDDREITLDVDGARRQHGRLSDMVHGVPELIAYLSGFYRLQPGDLLFTGTPAGVGALAPGARLSGRIPGLPSLELTIGPAA